MADLKDIPKSNSTDNLSSILSLLGPLFLGSGTTTSKEGNNSKSSIDPAILMQLLGISNNATANAADTSKTTELVKNIMSQASQSFLPVAGAQNAAGLYDTKTLELLRNNAMATASAAAAKSVLDYTVQQQGIATGALTTVANNSKSVTENKTGTKATAPVSSPLQSVLGIGGTLGVNALLKSEKFASLLEKAGNKISSLFDFTDWTKLTELGQTNAGSFMGDFSAMDGFIVPSKSSSLSLNPFDFSEFETPTDFSSLLNFDSSNLFSSASEALDVSSFFPASSSDFGSLEAASTAGDSVFIGATSSELVGAAGVAAAGTESAISGLSSVATGSGSLAGIGLGMGLNSLLGGNKLNGTIGSVGGTAVGAIIGSTFGPVGTLIGSLFGGAIGGGGGGLLGPTAPNGYSSTGIKLKDNRLAVGLTNSQLMDKQSTAERKYSIEYTDAFNKYLDIKNVNLTGIGKLYQIGQNTPGKTADPSKFANFNTAFSGFEFGSDNPRVNSAVAGKSFSSYADLYNTLKGFSSNGTRITAPHEDYNISPEELAQNEAASRSGSEMGTGVFNTIETSKYTADNFAG